MISRNVVDRMLNLHEAVHRCLEAELRESALILMYAGIDAFAWLNAPRSRENVTRADFMTWCSDYLLPGSDLRCTTEDLYGARCAILHSQTAESSLSRRGKARMIWYSYGTQSAESLQKSIDKLPDVSAVAVHIETLAVAFAKGSDRFFAAASASPVLTQQVNERGEKYFREFVPGSPTAEFTI